MRCDVYWHSRLKLWSVRVDGLVIEHVCTALLYDCTFMVQERARQRVVDTGKREVHAFVRGTWRAGVTDHEVPVGYDRVTYNPHRGPYFTVMPGSLPIRVADTVLLLPDGTAWARDWRS